MKQESTDRFCFASNQIKSLSPTIFDQLTNLETIDFYFNQIEYLDSDIFRHIRFSQKTL